MTDRDMPKTVYPTIEGVKNILHNLREAYIKEPIDASTSETITLKFYYKLSDEIDIESLSPIVFSIGTRVADTTYAVIEKECKGPFDYEKLAKINAIELARMFNCDIKKITFLTAFTK